MENKKNCDHLFETVNPNSQYGPFYGACKYCGKTPNDIFLDEALNETLADQLIRTDELARFGCAMKENIDWEGLKKGLPALPFYNDPAHIAFPGHELNHK